MDFIAEKIFTHLQNYGNRDQNFVTLKRKLEYLIGVKEDKESIKSIELLHPRKKLKKSAEIWFRNAERVTVEILNDLENEITRSNVLSHIGEKVLERIQEVEELLQQSESFDSLVIDDPQWIGQVLSTTTLFGEVPKTLMEEIWEYLMDDKVSKIGVCGMGGVGKTTIMKLIHNQLVKETQKFNKVIWVTVSKEINITKLQNDIQKATGVSLLKDDDDDKTIRAGKLREQLSKLGKYVLILDDLWTDLSLEEVGIPEPSNGSKLVITTRLFNVCHYLNCREVKIPTLPQPDAWSLFLEKVGHDILNYPDILPIVKDVVDECDGLPLAIVTIASSMSRVHDTRIWRNALCELQEHVKSVDGKEQKIFQQLQFSYDRLEDEKVKLCFLCCALYPEDFEIKRGKLINLWIAEGYVEELSSLQAEIDKGHAILNKLKNSSLIEDGSDTDNTTVKLHDIVRDMALNITSARPHFLVRAGMNLMKLPDLKEWKEGLEKVSLMENWRLQIPSKMPPPNCPVLTTLLLSDCEIESIPACFFEQMPGLKILDLSENWIKSLPISISHLESLTTLLLRRCWDLEEIPSLSKLQALKRLDLSRTRLEEFPHGIDQMINLRYLNLSGTRIRKMDLGILAKLTSLLHLEIIPSYDDWEPWKIELGDRAEIKLLLQLEFLEMLFTELDEFNRCMQPLEDTREGKGPRNFKIIVSGLGLGIIGFDKEEEENLILFENTEICTENMKLPSNVKILKFWVMYNRREDEVFLSKLITCCGNTSFSSLKTIIVNSFRGIRKLFSLDWILHNLHNLEYLHVFGDYGSELNEIIGSESEIDLDEEPIKYYTLPQLKTLELKYIPELNSICNEKVSLLCDSIESIIISECPKLKKIPLIFPLGDDGLPSPPPLKEIYAYPKDWWETVEWCQPEIKSMVERLVQIEDIEPR